MINEGNTGTSARDNLGKSGHASTKSESQEVAKMELWANRVRLTRTIFMNFAFLLIGIALVSVIALELYRDTIIIEPFGVPKEFSEQGYSGEILARQLIDEYSKIRIDTPLIKRTIDTITNPAITPEFSQTDFHIPGIALSLASVIRYIKESFRFSNLRLISGEITRDGSGFRLHLREFQEATSLQFSDLRISSLEEIDILIHHGARDLLMRIDPIVLAYYLVDKDIDGASKIIMSSLTSNSVRDVPLAYYLQGMILEHKRYYEEALEYYERVITEKDDFFHAYISAGRVLGELKRFSESSNKHAKAVRIAPKEAYAYVSWGKSLRLAESFDEANDKFEKAAPNLPNNMHFYHEWSELRKEVGDTSGYLKKSKVAVTIAPYNYLANFTHGKALIEGEQYKEAEKYLKRAIDLNDKHVSTYISLALSLESQRKYSKAAMCYDRALSMDAMPEEAQQMYKQKRNAIYKKHINIDRSNLKVTCL